MHEPTDGGGSPPDRRAEGPSGELDWGLGRYEETAVELLPAARKVVGEADIRDGERVIDLGCGTGNAALIAAGLTAHVIGVDPATRLLDVARQRAAGEHLDINFVRGRAESMPLADASADAILSVFAVIFSSQPADAAAEVMRVLIPGGRFVFSAWLPRGTNFRVNAMAADQVRKALGAPAPPPPFAWHDPEAVRTLFAPYGVDVSTEEHSLAFTDASPASCLERQSRGHPLVIAGERVLAQHGNVAAVRAQLLEMLTEGNEDPQALRITSDYVITTVQRT